MFVCMVNGFSHDAGTFPDGIGFCMKGTGAAAIFFDGVCAD
jgi:hypothetical protein